MQQETVENKSQEQRNKKKRYLIFLAFLLVVLGTYSVYYFYSHDSKEQVSIISGEFLPEGKDAKKMTENEIADFAQKKADSSKFNMIIGSKSEIDSLTQSGKLSIKNPKVNTYPVNVVITDDQSKEIVYTSGAINPGEEVRDVKLEKKLSKGTHKATARFSLYDPKTEAKRGEVAAGVNFIVN